MTTSEPDRSPQIPGLVPSHRGKTRDVYDLGEHLLIVASDRISAFGSVLPSPIPQRGRIVTQLSAFWFARTASIVPNHDEGIAAAELVEGVEPRVAARSIVAHRAEPLPVRAVVRGYLTGSAWAEYKETGKVCGAPAPRDFCRDNQLPKPMFTPSLPGEPGERPTNLTFKELVKLLGRRDAVALADASIALYRFAAELAATRGIVVADTEFQFGRRDGELILLGELLTPDCTRFWDAGSRDLAGVYRRSLDRFYVRDWLVANGWTGRGAPPDLPGDVVREASLRYREAFKRLTGPRLQTSGP